MAIYAPTESSEQSRTYAWLMRAGRWRMRGIQIALIPFVCFISFLAIISIGFIVPFKMSASNQPTTSPVEFMLYFTLGGAFLCLPVGIVGGLIAALGDAWLNLRCRSLPPHFVASPELALEKGERLGWWFVRECAHDAFILRRQPIHGALWTLVRWVVRSLVTTLACGSIWAGWDGGVIFLGVCGAAASLGWGLLATSFVMEREIEIRIDESNNPEFVVRWWLDPLLPAKETRICPLQFWTRTDKRGMCLGIDSENRRSFLVDRLFPGLVGRWQAERLKHTIESIWIRLNVRS